MSGATRDDFGNFARSNVATVANGNVWIDPAWPALAPLVPPLPLASPAPALLGPAPALFAPASPPALPNDDWPALVVTPPELQDDPHATAQLTSSGEYRQIAVKRLSDALSFRDMRVQSWQRGIRSRMNPEASLLIASRLAPFARQVRFRDCLSGLESTHDVPLLHFWSDFGRTHDPSPR